MQPKRRNAMETIVRTDASNWGPLKGFQAVDLRFGLEGFEIVFKS